MKYRLRYMSWRAAFLVVACSSPKQEAKKILDATGVKGGLNIDNLVNLVVSESLGSVSMDAGGRIFCSDGVLFLLVNKSPQSYEAFKPQEVGIGAERDRIMQEFPWNEKPREIAAIQADTGKVLWKEDCFVLDQRRSYED